MVETREIEGIIVKDSGVKEVACKDGKNRIFRSIELQGTDIRFSLMPFKQAKETIRKVFGEVMAGDKVRFKYAQNGNYYNIDPNTPIEIIEMTPEEREEAMNEPPEKVKAPEEGGRQQRLTQQVKQGIREANLKNLVPKKLLHLCMEEAKEEYMTWMPEELEEKYVKGDPLHMQNITKIAMALSVLHSRKLGI